MALRIERQAMAWAFYDWANSAFATIVIAGFFPIFFKQYWAQSADVSTSTFYLGIANATASILVAALAPLLGAIADRGGRRKKFLTLFILLGIVSCGGLVLVADGHWQMAVILFVLASIGFSAGNVFYDALLVDVAAPRHYDKISVLGYSLGYLGGGLAFLIAVLAVLNPHVAGFETEAEAMRMSFIFTSLWWGVCAIPIIYFVTEAAPVNSISLVAAIQSGWGQLKATLKDIRSHRQILIFLLAYWLYIDGVDTFVRMAIDYGLSLGFDSHMLILALLLTQFIGFPATLLFGKFSHFVGARSAILCGLMVYAAITVWASLMNSTWEFYVIAALVGLVQGGVQAMSRSIYAGLIPKNKAAEFFGFYNMLGKFAAIIGPLMIGWISVLSGNPRLSILSLLVLFGLGGFLLSRVNVNPTESTR